MPHDPILSAETLARLHDIEARFVEVQEARRRAIVEAVRADVPLREVAAAAHCSHETIRRVVAIDGAVTLGFAGHEYPLPGQTIHLLVYKLAGHARGAFAADLDLINAGHDWLAPAGVLADELQAAMADEEGSPVVLDEPQAFALHQILRLTALKRPSVVSRLADALRDSYGYPPYPPDALRRWTRTIRRGEPAS